MQEVTMLGSTNVFKRRQNSWEKQQLNHFASLALSGQLSYPDFVKACVDADKQNHRMSRINFKVRCFRNDGIFQLNEAIKKTFGAIVSSAEQDSGPSADQTVNMVDVELADGTRTKVPYGDISLDVLGEGSSISINYDDDSHHLLVTGKCPQMYMSIMDSILEDTKKAIATKSIYHAQAISITDINNPEILNLSATDDQLMVLSDQTQYSLRPIYARIRRPEECMRKGIPLKYGTLLAGSYGTGKTLLAFKIAKEAIEHGWIFIYLKEPTLLAETLRMAKTIDKSGPGVVLFLEDVDQVTRGDRDAAMQDILNTLDGGDTKDMNVISIFTTNHLDLIEPTFLRGKRISSIITLGALDAKTADTFIRASMSQLNEDGTPMYELPDDLSEACKIIEENHIVPAFMADIVEAVKTTMIISDEKYVNPEYFVFEVKQHVHHVKLAQTKDMSETPEKKLVNSVNTLFGLSDMNERLSELQKQVEQLIDMNS